MRWMDRVIIIRRFWIWLCVIEACQCPRNFRPPARILPIPECQRLKYFCLILSVVMNRPNTAVQLRLPHFVVAATSFNRVVSLWPAPGERQWSGKPTSRFSVGRLYLTLHCHHQNDSCIKMGSDKSQFNVHYPLSVQMRDITTWSRTSSVHRPQLLTSEEKGEPTEEESNADPSRSLLTRLTPYRSAKPALYRPTYTPDSSSRLLYVHGSYWYGLLGTGSPAGTATSTTFTHPAAPELWHARIGPCRLFISMTRPELGFFATVVPCRLFISMTRPEFFLQPLYHAEATHSCAPSPRLFAFLFLFFFPFPILHLLSFHLSLPHLFPPCSCSSLVCVPWAGACRISVSVYVCKCVWRKCPLSCVYNCTKYND